MPDTPGGKNIRAAVEVFIADKKVENLSSDLIRKYERELGRLASFCEGRGVYSFAGINRELITQLCSDWKDLYPSSLTRNKLAGHYKSFLEFCLVA